MLMRFTRPTAVIAAALIAVLAFTGCSSASKTRAGADTSTSTSARADTIVQDVVGMDGAQAKDALELLGLEVEYDGGEDTVIIKKNWTVTETDPAADTVLPVGSTVTLKVRKVDANATLDGLTSGEAMTYCKRLGAEQYPYGFDVKSFTGDGDIVVDDHSVRVSIDVEVTNEANATKRERMRCEIGGTRDEPEVVSFTVGE